ncbi:enoyl-CoA delta isomerase 3-like [Magnolia sinica]|uniref:enoyl-CoA delta isomerase 3-like n=1 Tax=Magnolia sinica TaxID=86752 RepID=UPI00265A3E3D|nr:enoyl-CoA delta isomerase 3-like [Magnolia sinica]
MEHQMVHLHQWPACRLERRGRVYILTLTGADDHRFNPPSLDDILTALKLVDQAPDAGALVTTNEGRYFSNGLDLKWIKTNLSHSALDIIRDKFEGMLSFMMKLGIPTLAAICGHAAAGGFMLALVHDYRFMTNGKGVLYMSELDHGMYMPRSLMSVIKSKLSPVSLREVVLKARKFTASEALEFRIIDGVYDDAAKTIDTAIVEAEKLVARGWKRDSYANLRAGAFPEVIEEIEARRDPYVWRLKGFSVIGNLVFKQ